MSDTTRLDRLTLTQKKSEVNTLYLGILILEEKIRLAKNEGSAYFDGDPVDFLELTLKFQKEHYQNCCTSLGLNIPHI